MVKVMRKAVMTTVMMITPVHGNIGGGDEVILRNDTDDCHNTIFTFIYILTPFFPYQQKLVFQIQTIHFIHTFILRFHTLIRICHYLL